MNKWCTKKYNVDKVVAEVPVQICIRQEEDLTPPANNLLPAIVEEINITDFHTLRNKVIIQGEVIKKIRYEPAGGNSNQQIETITLDFCEDVDVPGFLPGRVVNGRRFAGGNDFRVLVDDVNVIQVPIFGEGEQSDRIVGVEEKVVIRLILKVLKEEQIDIPFKTQPVFECKSARECNYIRSCE